MPLKIARILAASEWLRDEACGGSRTGVDEALSHRLDAEVQALQRAGPEEREIVGLSEHDIVGRRRAGDIEPGRTSPSLEGRPISLAEAPDLAALDAERFEVGGGKPRQLGAGVDEDVWQSTSFAGSGRVFNLDFDTKAAHLIRHCRSLAASSCHRIVAEWGRCAQGRRGQTRGLWS